MPPTKKLPFTDPFARKGDKSILPEETVADAGVGHPTSVCAQADSQCQHPRLCLRDRSYNNATRIHCKYFSKSSLKGACEHFLRWLTVYWGKNNTQVLPEDLRFIMLQNLTDLPCLSISQSGSLWSYGIHGINDIWCKIIHIPILRLFPQFLNL